MKMYYVVVECLGRSITKSSNSEAIKKKKYVTIYIVQCFGKPKTL